jgi:hypothetical protein
MMQDDDLFPMGVEIDDGLTPYNIVKLLWVVFCKVAPFILIVMLFI